MALTVWIVADDCGAYTLSVRGTGAAYDGTAKLDSEPNAGLLRGADGASAAFALFALRDGAYGLRGFAQDEHGMITWELALRPIAAAAIGGNVGRVPTGATPLAGAVPPAPTSSAGWFNR